MVRPLSDREELFAVAAWRQLLMDRAAGREQTPETYAALFPAAGPGLLSELAGDIGERPGVVIGHYRLVELLGRGGQGSVWCAADLLLSDRQVALKLIPLFGGQAMGAALRLRREIALAVRADVPGVCPVYDTGQDGDYAWIAMRRCEGRTLAQRLLDSGGTARPSARQIEERLQWLERAARAVDLVHARGVVHRDLKPGNLMIADDGGCVLLDFGVARALDDGPDGVTVTGAAPGTPAFMAPEQVQGQVAGPAADIWALGVMLYECVTGQRPFAGATRFELQEQIVNVVPAAPRRVHRGVSADLSVVIETALQKRGEHRYQSALLLADDLRRVLEGRPVLVRRIGPVTRLWRLAQRRPLVVSLLVLLFVAVAVGLAVSLLLLGRANREVVRADQAQRFVERLTDRTELAALRRELEEELAIDSTMVDRFLAWHGRGDRLLARRQAHEEFLAQIRQQALPPGPETPAVAERRRDRERGLQYARSRVAAYEQQLAAAEVAGIAEKIKEAQSTLKDARDIERNAVQALVEAGGFRFADAGMQAMHDQVEALVREIGAFAERRPGLPTQLAGRLLWRLAERVRKESVEQHAAAWAQAIARIALPEGPYRGLQLTPQEGLVPLGPDRESGFEEFAQLFTGSIPLRSGDGVLGYEPDAAIVLVLLPGGEARLGPGRELESGMKPRFVPIPPPAVVQLEPFFLGKHEVTQSQWFSIQWGNPAVHQDSEDRRRRYPVENVTALEAATFARRLRLSLPSEAQWEYACRAGSGSLFAFGDDPAAISGFGNVFEDVPTTMPAPDGYHRVAPVGQYPSNAFGLCDLHGNVREWTSDSGGWYDKFTAGADGRRKTSDQRVTVVRGGSFLLGAAAAQSWWRESEPFEHRLGDLGFRVARAVEPR